MPERPPPREQPAQQPPPVQRLRMRYAKRGRLRFTSHRDFGRAFERAVNRARLPVAYSSGFSPHPRISYANASPTGAASEAEYLEIGLTEHTDSALVQRVLDDALPPGLDVLDVVVAGAGSLAERLEASRWRIELAEVDEADAEEASRKFLAAEAVEVERMTKRGNRRFDCRSAVLSLGVVAPPVPGDAENRARCAILEAVVRHETPAVRPDDILVGLSEIAGLVVPVPPLVTRLAQGPLDPRTGRVGDPLGPDRDAARQVPAGDR